MPDSILRGNLGSEASYGLTFENGQLVFSMVYDGDGVDGRLEIMLDPAYFLDQLAKAIPGQVDDAVIAMLKAAFLKH